MPAPAVPSLVDTLGAEALDWLSTLAGRLALRAAVFGAVFVPSPSGGTSEQGPVPDRPGMSYHLDRDTGTLRLSLDSDPDPDHALVALLETDGIYRDVATKVAIARAVGSAAVIIDLDLDAFDGGAPKAVTYPGEPKLCSAPSEDQGGGRKLFDILYEQWVRNWVNPQRKPQLPPEMAFALPADMPSGWVRYDDCREATGAMIEAKGNYASVVATQWGRDILQRKWLKQAKAQISGANGRPIEWYFHDASAAAFAKGIFSPKGYDRSISIHVLPYEGGVPKYNPRIKL